MAVVLVSYGLSNTLLLPFALSELNATEFEYGLQEGLTSIGFVVGSLLMAKLFDRLHPGAWMAISFLGMGIIGVVYSALESIPWAIILITLSGMLNAPSAIGRRVIVQRNTPAEMRGRVSSAFFVARDMLFLVGMGAAGLADFMGVRFLYLVSSVMLVAAGGLVLFIISATRLPATTIRPAATVPRYWLVGFKARGRQSHRRSSGQVRHSCSS